MPDLARAAGRLAEAIHGDVVLLHVVPVAFGAPVADAAASRAAAERVFSLARAQLPRPEVWAEARAASHVGGAIRQALRDLDASLMLTGWRDAASLDRLARGTLRPILQNPPCDVALVRLDTAREARFAGGERVDEIEPLALRVVASHCYASGSTLALLDSLGPRAQPRILPFARRSLMHRFLEDRAPGLEHDVLLAERDAPLAETIARMPPFDLAVLPASWPPDWRGLKPLGLAAGDQGNVLLLALRTGP